MKGASVVKILSVFALFILFFGIALPALADYLGPNRTVTTWVWERKRCEYLALYDPPGAGYFACTLHLYEPPDGTCPATGSTAPYFNPHPHACGTSWPGTCGVDIPCQISLHESLEACREGESGCQQMAHTATYPEATVYGELRNCGLQNGWCVTSSWLSLKAVEPLTGYSITAIEGTQNGETFACQSAACEIPLREGENFFTYWALSSWGDSSRMGSLTALVDTRPPQIQGAVSGTVGENGWYVSPVTFAASASDPEPGSGITALTYTLNGGDWTPYTAPLVVSDGVHTILFRAQDSAGHISEHHQSVQVDTLPPLLETALNGEQVNGWYSSQVVFSASASDSGSGLARLEYALDGGDWCEYNAPLIIGDGVHTLRARAFDLAGNATELAPRAFQVDGTRPGIALPESWPIWERVELTAHDGQSGLAKVEVTIRDQQSRWPAVVWAYAADGQSFTTEIAWNRRFGDGTLAPIGEYQVIVEASDRAGNVSRQTVHILIPAPNLTPTPLSTHTLAPTPNATASPPAFIAASASPLLTPTRTSGNVGVMFPAAPDTSPAGTTGSSWTGSETQSRIERTSATVSDSPFPWWLIVVGGAAVYAVSKRKQIADFLTSRQNEAQQTLAKKAEAEKLASAQDKDDGERTDIGNPVAGLAGEEVDRWLQAQNAMADRRHTATMWGEARYHAEAGSWDWERVDRKIDNYAGRTARQIEELAVEGKLSWKDELRREWVTFREKWTMRLNALREHGLKGLFSRPRAGEILDGVDSVSDGLSIVGHLGHAVTGDARWKVAGDVGDALGILGGIRQIAQCSRAAGQAVQTIGKAGAFWKGVTLLGKVTGALSIVTGLVGMVGGGMQVAHSLEDGKADAETWIGALNGLAGLSATIGGIMLLVPGAQPVAGVLLGASAVLSGVATIIENREWISATFQRGKQIVWETSRPIREPAARIIEHGGEMQAQQIERRGEQIARAVSQAAENAAQFIERGAQTAGRKVQAASQAMSRSIETIGNVTAQGVRQAAQAAAQAANNAGQALARESERAASTVASWVRPFSPALANSVERTGQALSQAVTNTTQRVSSVISQVGQAASSVIQRGTQAAASAVNGAGQIVANVIVRAGQGAANFVRGAGQAVSSSVCTVTQAASSVVRNLTSSFANWLRRP